MQKRGRFTPWIATFIALFMLRFFGPIQTFFEWTHMMTRLTNAALIIVCGFVAT